MKVLVVKLSSLGDVVHAMPAVQDIRQALPNAVIDWVVEPGFASLVRRCEGVRRVITCNQRQWRKAMLSPATRQAWTAFKTDLRAEAYDAVIDLQGLTKSALVSHLARLSPEGKRYAMANRTDGSGYEAPTRWVADVAVPVTQHSHAVARSRELCAKALGYAWPLASPGPGLQALEHYGLHARQESSSAAMDMGAPGTSGVYGVSVGSQQVALVHGTSRADKLWSEAHWVALAQRLLAQGMSIALLHGTDHELARSESIAHAVDDPRIHIWPRLSLDVLTDQLARETVGVIGVDSGLSHIAVALDLPHVQIYNFDTAWRTGPQGSRQRSVFAQPQPSVDQVWQAWLAVSAVEQSLA